jgi:hypothetical protein
LMAGASPGRGVSEAGTWVLAYRGGSVAPSRQSQPGRPGATWANRAPRAAVRRRLHVGVWAIRASMPIPLSPGRRPLEAVPIKCPAR